jgi:hypothetical protein
MVSCRIRSNKYNSEMCNIISSLKIVDVGAWFGCHGNVFTRCCLAMEDFPGPAIQILAIMSQYQTQYLCIIMQYHPSHDV